MHYSNYKKTRNLSWKILLEQRANRLPIKISDICKSKNIKVYSYQQCENMIKNLHLEDYCMLSDGFCINYNNQDYIFYNAESSEQKRRFTVAHELGHILLGHLNQDHVNFCLTEQYNTDIEIERQANMFASRLLSPACVLWGMGATTPEQIAEICNISLNAAMFRMIRMKKLYQREEVFLKKNGTSCFLKSNLEKDLYNNFSDFIIQNRFHPVDSQIHNQILF